jgi:chromosome segregation ATPase
MIEEEKNLDSLRNHISEVFQPLEKPVEKLLKTTDSKKGLLTSEAQETLQLYLNDPVTAVENEKESFTRLRSALEALRNVLNSGAIELKESRVRNALKRISEICLSSNLETLRQSYHRLQLEHYMTSSSKEAVEIFDKRSKLEKQKQQVTNDRSRLDSDLGVLQSRRYELSLRLSRLKTDLEDRSNLVAGEEIEILQDRENPA